MTANPITSEVDILQVIPNFLNKYGLLFKPIPSSTPTNLKALTEKLTSHYKHSKSIVSFSTCSSLDMYMKQVRSYLDSINIKYQTFEKTFSKNLYKKKITLIFDINTYPSSVSKPQSTAPVPQKISETSSKDISKASSNIVSLLKNLKQNEDFEFLSNTYWYKLCLSAKLRNIPFSLTLSHVKKLLKTKKCFYLGIPLDESNFTVDRLECEDGYTNKNTVACSALANHLKNNTIESFNIPSHFLQRILIAREKGLIKEPEDTSLVRKRERKS